MVALDITKNMLEERLVELHRKLNEISDELRQPDSADWEDRATENEGDEVLEDMGIAAQAEIAQINSALQRIAIGTYGECTSCGDPIDQKRLKALPYAASCMDCAVAAEG